MVQGAGINFRANGYKQQPSTLAWRDDANGFYKARQFFFMYYKNIYIGVF